MLESIRKSSGTVNPSKPSFPELLLVLVFDYSIRKMSNTPSNILFSMTASVLWAILHLAIFTG